MATVIGLLPRMTRGDIAGSMSAMVVPTTAIVALTTMYVVVVSPPRVFPMVVEIGTSPPICLGLWGVFELTRLSIAWCGYATERG